MPTARANGVEIAYEIFGAPEGRPLLLIMGLAAQMILWDVIHGRDDPLIPVEAGLATARAVRGAELLVVDGMGHDLPRAVWPSIVDRISALTARA